MLLKRIGSQQQKIETSSRIQIFREIRRFGIRGEQPVTERVC